MEHRALHTGGRSDFVSVSQAERTAPRMAFPWPVPQRPMMFYVQLGMEEISASGTSYLNRLGEDLIPFHHIAFLPLHLQFPCSLLSSGTSFFNSLYGHTQLPPPRPFSVFCRS